MFSESVLIVFFASFCYICQLFESHFIPFCSVLFNSLLFNYSMFCYSFIKCYIFYVLILEVDSRYFDPTNHISKTIWQVNKHHTSDCTIFVVVKKAEGLLPLKDIVWYPEPISPIGLAEVEALRGDKPMWKPLFVHSVVSYWQNAKQKVSWQMAVAMVIYSYDHDDSNTHPLVGTISSDSNIGSWDLPIALDYHVILVLFGLFLSFGSFCFILGLFS
jgi:hypothetical protein